MVSYISLQYYINGAVELIAILFLIVLIISSVSKKSTNHTKKQFSLLVIDHILLLFCNMITWILAATYASQTYPPSIYNLVFTLTVFDFLFYCLAAVCFLNYLCTLTEWIKNKKKKHYMIIGFTAYSFVMTIIYAFSSKFGWIYYFREDGYIYYTAQYWILFAMSIPSVCLSYYIILKNRKQLERKVFPLLIYLILPMVLAIIDQLFNLSISYVCLAFNVLSIYVGVDVEQDRKLLEQESVIIKQKAENIEMGVKLMTSQIQPHFLYNTLGTIYHLCGKNVDLAQETIKNFIKYLRTNMESLEKSSLVPFEQELEHTKNYLFIEMLRFSDVLKVEYDIGNTDFNIPVLSLQPLVENAVKHGIRSRTEGGTVTISTKRENGKIYISVHDDGMGYDTERLPDDGRMHVGIANVRKRLDYMCNGKLEIESKIGVGTTTTIVLEDVKNELTAD